jgi:hypothetical protein
MVLIRVFVIFRKTEINQIDERIVVSTNYEIFWLNIAMDDIFVMQTFIISKAKITLNALNGLGCYIL